MVMLYGPRAWSDVGFGLNILVCAQQPGPCMFLFMCACKIIFTYILMPHHGSGLNFQLVSVCALGLDYAYVLISFDSQAT